MSDENQTPSTEEEPTESQASAIDIFQEEPEEEVNVDSTPVAKKVVAEETIIVPKAEVNFQYVTGIVEADRALKDVPSSSLTGILRIVEYIKKMNPKKPIEVSEGAKLQAALFRVIQSTINKEEKHFKQIFSAMLAIFLHEKNGVFHESCLFRFMDNVPLNGNEIKAFTRLLNLMKLTCSKESRAVTLKQVDIGKTLQYGLTDDGRRKLIDFYNIGR